MVIRYFAALVIVAATILAAMEAHTEPAQLSATEAIYARLGTQPTTERARLIEEGARREGKLVLVHTLRGELGAGHIELFRRRFPFLVLDVAGEIGSRMQPSGYWPRKLRDGT
jgi:hypothetical protein